MRKLLISILLAGAATSPAFAGPHNNDDAAKAAAQRQQARDDRQQARQQAREERAPAPSAERMNAHSRPDTGNATRGYGFAGPQAGPAPQQRVFDGQRGTDPQEQRDAYQQRYQPQRFDQQRYQPQRYDEQRYAGQPGRNSAAHWPVSNVPRPGTQPPAPVAQRYTPTPQWNTSWHHDSRYDWQNYRNRNRSLFHLGFYYDPFGWGYQPYSIGWRLWPDYYSSNFWINDPWQYRLPYAPPGLVWIRYFNDALLVDTYSGEVVDSIPGFFW